MLGIVDTVRDTRKIASHPLAGMSRFGVFRTYVRLAALASRNRGPGQTTVLGHQIGYLDPVNLLQLFREIFVMRFYDMPVISTAPTIIDCGSNIGMSILYFTVMHPHASIIGFEPNPGAFDVLKKNVTQNGMRNVCLHQVALADTEGTLDFFLPKDLGALNAGMYAPSGKEKISVHAERLSDYITRPVDLLKLDIEGAENLVLDDLVSTNKLRLVDSIVMEYHHHLNADRDALGHTIGQLERAGFGYQLNAYSHHSTRKFRHQDILIYAYRKASVTGTRF